jgi:hypothetical protein
MGDNIKNYLRKIGWEGTDWMHLPQGKLVVLKFGVP